MFNMLYTVCVVAPPGVNTFNVQNAVCMVVPPGVNTFNVQYVTAALDIGLQSAILESDNWGSFACLRYTC